MANKYKDIKVTIAIACQDTIKAYTGFALYQSTKNLPFQHELVLRKGCDIIGSRIWLARKAIENGSSHILFIDHDMFFPPMKQGDGSYRNPIRTLVDYDLDVVGADYNFRELPLKSVVFPLDGIPREIDKLYKCRALGTGFMLIKTDVLKNLGDAFDSFQFGRGKDGELIQGEDAFFCENARKHGYEIWADPTLGIKHIGDLMF